MILNPSPPMPNLHQARIERKRVMDTTNPITVRLDCELHQTARDVSRLTGITFRELVERGLAREIEHRLRTDERLSAAHCAMKRFREPPDA